jgi:pimeloyl-ACP methyl ester carboxylesterase
VSRSIAGVTVILLITLTISLASHPTKGFLGPCCQYSVYSSDSQPKPAERVDLTGVVTDDWGGGLAGVQIHYTDSGNYHTPLNTTSNANGAWRLSVNMPSVTIQYPMRFTITMKANQSWSSSLVDSYSYVSSSGDVPAIYESDFSGKLNAYINIQSIGNPVVLFLSGGYDQPILTGDSQLNQDTLNLLSSIANAGYNVVAPIGWFVTNQPIFPYLLASLMKNGLGISQVYLLGWSAGGTVAAWTLINDNYGLFNLAVIMDAELQGPAGSTSTDLSVFRTAALSSQAKVPHLLIWGTYDSGSVDIGSAFIWIKNAPGGFARLDPFPYSHVWIGTSTQPEILEDILAFFKTQYVGSASAVQAGNVTLQLLTNSKVNFAASGYNSTSKSFTFQLTQANGTVGSLNAVIPKSSIYGPPVALLDNNTVNAPYSTEASTYHLYLTYPMGSHAIVIEGQNAVPEFSGLTAQLVALGTSLVSLIIALSFRKTKKFYHGARKMA